MSDSKDAAIIAVQLGRAQRARSTVVARCPLQLPVVLAVPPRLDTGEPFPTRYWLSCPLAHKRIARLEAQVRADERELRVEETQEEQGSGDGHDPHRPGGRGIFPGPRFLLCRGGGGGHFRLTWALR